MKTFREFMGENYEFFPHDTYQHVVSVHMDAAVRYIDEVVVPHYAEQRNKLQNEVRGNVLFGAYDPGRCVYKKIEEERTRLQNELDEANALLERVHKERDKLRDECMCLVNQLNSVLKMICNK